MDSQERLLLRNIFPYLCISLPNEISLDILFFFRKKRMDVGIDNKNHVGLTTQRLTSVFESLSTDTARDDCSEVLR